MYLSSISNITLSGVLDYLVIPLSFVIFVIAMFRLLKNKNRVKPSDEDEDGLK